MPYVSEFTIFKSDLRMANVTLPAETSSRTFQGLNWYGDQYREYFFFFGVAKKLNLLILFDVKTNVNKVSGTSNHSSPCRVESRHVSECKVGAQLTYWSTYYLFILLVNAWFSFAIISTQFYKGVIFNRGHKT